MPQGFDSEELRNQRRQDQPRRALSGGEDWGPTTQSGAGAGFGQPSARQLPAPVSTSKTKAKAKPPDRRPRSDSNRTDGNTWQRLRSQKLGFFGKLCWFLSMVVVVLVAVAIWTTVYIGFDRVNGWVAWIGIGLTIGLVLVAGALLWMTRKYQIIGAVVFIAIVGITVLIITNRS